MVYITTVDNPWNPFTNWDEWLQYDRQMGYYTCEKLDRLAPTSEILPDTINKEIINEAHQEMLKEGTFDKQGNFVEYKLIYSSENKD